ncbi:MULTISPECIES: DUF1707 SHOCT-like domain-containing protein [unclassified Nonomuraea]|uniref:DUF1707 SHOCT-like domain-containing protein n=1 Tax=Nonomuraea sp. NPDC049725 TaxID=3154508 RepID=UPI0034441821
MAEHRDVRASDADREAAARRLRTAVEEGCLDLPEFDDRVGRALGATTRGELAVLLADLPAEPRPAPPPARPAGTPRWLRTLWAVWGAILAVNVVAWGVVSVAEACPAEFWPKDLLGPALVLAVVTAVNAARRRGTPPGGLSGGGA